MQEEEQKEKEKTEPKEQFFIGLNGYSFKDMVS